MNAVCERSDKSKALTHEDPVHVLIGLTWCSVPDFVGPFELILNTERVRHMKSIGTTVIAKSILDREKSITLMAKNYFQSLNVSNTCNILSSHKNLLGPFHNCDAEYQIAPK